MRLRYNQNAEEELLNSKYLIKDFPVHIDNNTIIELGMGKGEMITQLAYANPNKKYIGVELYATVAHKAMKRAEKLNLTNFSIIWTDIRNLPDLLNGKVKTIWLTFSDPWPKNRHEKRRLTYRSFLEIYTSILDHNGAIKFKTDNDKLFAYSLESFTENNWELKHVTNDFHNSPYCKNNIMTGYEKKWSEQGKNINYLEASYKKK